jgi:hypothetical protein
MWRSFLHDKATVIRQPFALVPRFVFSCHEKTVSDDCESCRLAIVAISAGGRRALEETASAQARAAVTQIPKFRADEKPKAAAVSVFVLRRRSLLVAIKRIGRNNRAHLKTFLALRVYSFVRSDSNSMSSIFVFDATVNRRVVGSRPT